MTLPAQEVIRSAKQVYNHLDLRDRIPLLACHVKNCPIEVQKMQNLFLTDKSEFTKVVREFLQWSPPKGTKKSVQDLTTRLDAAIDAFCALIIDDDTSTPPPASTPLPNKAPTTTATKGKRPADSEAVVVASSVLGRSAKRVRSSSVGSSASSNGSTVLVSQTSSVASTSTTTSSSSPLTPPLSPFEQSQADAMLGKSCSSNSSFNTATTNNSKSNILYNPPRGTKCYDGVPWAVQYEIARFITSCHIQDLTFEILQRFLDVAKAEPRNLFQSMMEWHGLRMGATTTKSAAVYGLMERCSDHVWTHLEKNQQQEEQQQQEQISTSSHNRMLHYSAVIALTNGKPPVIELRPPKVAASNRFFRKYGDDRFLELKLDRGTHPAMIRKHQDYFLKPFLLMGRTYRFLFIKDDKVILFATEGSDLAETMTIRQVIDWHIPILDNWDMTISKFSSRMTLGYSNSIPTLTFDPDKVQYIDDIYSDALDGDGNGRASGGGDEGCMTDGCGLISVSAMRKIMGCEHSDTLPCAVQGRIGGAKGIWIVEPDLDFNSGDWIKIRRSQHKFKTGVLQYDMKIDPIHYTFDLVKNSICVYPSNLNTQFIQCLSSGGVPASVFVDLLHEYLHRLTTVVTENRNIRLLRDWIAKTGCIMRSRWEMEDTEKDIWREQQSVDSSDDYLEVYSPGEDYGTSLEGRLSSSNSSSISSSRSVESDYWKINSYSGLPAALHESTVRLLDSGFDLSNPHVATKVTHIFRDVMKSVCTKYKIEVQQSCTVTCIPDPTGILEEGEVFLQLSNRKIDEKTGIPAGLVTGDVIVTRNPCGLKSDIQKVKAVDRPELRIYTDVIIFPIKGKRSLASYLGGGDYDGDIVFCCWDQRIVEPFIGSEMPDEPEQMKTVFEKNETRVRQELIRHRDENAQEQALQKHFIAVTVPDGTLGQYENWRTVLSETVGLGSSDVIYLSHMCAKLVDAPKQGLALKPSVLRRDRNTFGKIPYPQWFQDKRNRQREKDFRSYQEVNQDVTLREKSRGTAMDQLYDALLEKTDAFTRYTRSMFDEQDVKYKDADLYGPWENAVAMAQKLKDKLFDQDLAKIKYLINEQFENYTRDVKELVLRRQRKTDSRFDPARATEPFLNDYNQYNTLFELEDYYSREFLTTPETVASSILQVDKQVNGEQMLQAIKASYAYLRTVQNEKYSKFCYIVAYDQLRRLKADARSKQTSKMNGYSEPVAPYMYTAMNLDRSWIRKIKESKSAADCGTAQVRLSIDSHLSAVLAEKTKNDFEGPSSDGDDDDDVIALGSHHDK
ncbi:RNA dependent RNA polymerase-domain-containing protein [Zychaea mexicana]|uniref:RNA dependent RNA polymerase-domain-containing protein n=1 Tax=Zychaea mexicana TaxID=64656 RepID=UPI0022FE9144|nr:RNA dependent RNA polymerase-domain-containing protein [Zychaea mexicana]KAI9493419.1 RNA dependent RNA polymerase-domain-containing protein [Zychaea mexicana]